MVEEISANEKRTFDARQIEISVEQKNVDFLLYKLEYDLDALEQDLGVNSEEGIIDLNTEFQRSADLWSPTRMSRLIESILIRFPLPAFYFDTAIKTRWQVIDGLQRLSTLRKFVLDSKNPLKLRDLEFLPQLNGITYKELPEAMKRTLKNAQVVLYLIRPGTPKQVKYRLFERINTGGMQLNYQEIRHAINQGISANYVKELANIPAFTTNIKISSRRMLDRELALRFLAFKFKHYQRYSSPFYEFLDGAMEEIAKITQNDRDVLREDFSTALLISKEVFGNHLFSRNIIDNSRYQFNKSLFEVWTVLISELSNQQQKTLVARKEVLIGDFKALFKDVDFEKAITRSTADKNSVLTRFEKIAEIIQKVLQG
ncbi:MAG: DUF262 domain-containing protein [Bacteroidia bacterium]